MIKRVIEPVSTLVQQVACPSYCLLCREPVQEAISLCEDCRMWLPWRQRSCVCCASLLPLDGGDRCGACLLAPPPFSRTFVCFDYEKPVVRFVTQLKFFRQLIYAQLLGRLLGEMLGEFFALGDGCGDVGGLVRPDCIIPVPLHKKRLRERGFNQALEIAKPVAMALGLPLALGQLYRRRHTQAQARLSALRRGRNVQGAFLVVGDVRGRRILLLDDVMTTGATARAAASSLLAAGAARVDVACCTRA